MVVIYCLCGQGSANPNDSLYVRKVKRWVIDNGGTPTDVTFKEPRGFTAEVTAWPSGLEYPADDQLPDEAAANLFTAFDIHITNELGVWRELTSVEKQAQAQIAHDIKQAAKDSDLKAAENELITIFRSENILGVNSNSISRIDRRQYVKKIRKEINTGKQEKLQTDIERLRIQIIELGGDLDDIWWHD